MRTLRHVGKVLVTEKEPEFYSEKISFPEDQVLII